MARPAQPLPRHGGDLSLATRLYGAPAGGWLDLSTGISPFGYPIPPLTDDAYRRLPDADGLAALIAAAREAYRVPDDIEVVAVPGSEIAIRLLPAILDADRATIVSPTYGSHAAAWRNVAAVASIEAVADGGVAVVVNPNNPDGRIASRDELARLAGRVAWLIVDEAFADVAPEASLIPAMRGRNAIVLRSLGKFYGLAGLRLGFVIAPEGVAARLRDRLGDWPVSGVALAAGTAALRDADWREATRPRLREASHAMRRLLAGHGLTIAGGTDLFTLIAADDAHGLHERLAERGIWTRAFADNPRWLRFGVADDTGRERLDTALRDLR